MQAVVLTLSGKNSGICLAVYCPEKNKLYRLVSDDKSGELPISWRNSLRLLDVIEFTPVAFIEYGPQVDNVQIDINLGIKNIGKYDKTIGAIYDALYSNRTPNGKVFGSTLYRLEKADYFRHSLELVKVTDLKIIKQVTGDKIKGKAEFMCNGSVHRFYSVTSYEYDIRYKDIDCWEIGNAYLVVSLPAEPYIFNGEDKGYYKFVSAIYEELE